MNSQKLLHPQEIEVFYILPALRRQFAVQMKAKGLKQKKIAELLQIEEAAVSQYLNNKRGEKINFEKAVIKEIAKSTLRITDSISLLRETQRLLNLIRSSGTLCKIHKKMSNVPMWCGPEFVDCVKSENNGGENVPNARLIN